jgi:hypothetical protein
MMTHIRMICGAWFVAAATQSLAFAQNQRPTDSPNATGQPASAPVADSNSPHIQVDPPEWDFGEIWYGEAAQGELTLKNTGQGPLEITRVKTSCGCTHAKLESQTLAPGETMPLKLTYKKDRAGNVSQVVRIFSNDPAQPTKIIRVKGKVKPVFEGLAPISFGKLASNDHQTRTLELKNALPEKVFLTIKDIRPNNSYYDIRLEEIEPGMHYRLTVATKPPLRSGALIANISFDTGLERIAKLSVPVRGAVVARVSVSPRTLWVSPRSSPGRERPVQVTYLAEQPIEITEIRTNHEGVKAKLTPAKEPRQPTRFLTRVILVTTPAAEEIPEEGTTLEILTSDTEFAKLEVPVRRAPRVGRGWSQVGGRRSLAERRMGVRERPAAGATSQGGDPKEVTEVGRKAEPTSRPAGP